MAAPTDRVSIPEGVFFTELSGESAILNTTTGRYYGLDEVGTRMWLLLTEHGYIEAAMPALLAEFDVDEDYLRRDLLALVEKLASHGLLRITPS